MTSRAALITGGTSVIGRRIVASLSLAGFRCTVLYHKNVATAQKLAQSYDVTLYQLDLREERLDLPNADYDVIVNNAGINRSGHNSLAVTREEMLQTYVVNVFGALATSQHYVPAMVERGWGRVVNINSLWGSGVAANRMSYSCSKHALRALTQTLALELAHTGVTVNEVAPGPVDTDMLRAIADLRVAAGEVASVNDYMAEVASGMPTRRLVSADSVASAVAFLVSNDGGDITGQTLNVSGAAEL